MKFIFDTGLTIGSGTFLLGKPITGLDSPDIRTTINNYSGRDGGRVDGSQLFSGRLISIPGFISADDCEDHVEQRIELTTLLPKNQDIGVEIQLTQSTSVYTTVRILDVAMDFDSKLDTNFKVDIYAGDPYFYTTEEFTVEIDKLLGGGFIIPFVLPVVFADGSAPTIVNNTGNVTVYPRFVINGETANPRFTNVDTGEFIELTLNASDGDVVVIDTKNRTATLNGASVLYLLNSSSTWLTLAPGNTRIQYSSSGGSDAGVATVTWRSAIASV